MSKRHPHKPLEGDNIPAVKQWLTANGFLWLRIPNTRVSISQGKLRHVPIDPNQVGAPDLVAWENDYRLEMLAGPPAFSMCYAIEVKAWNGVQSYGQIEWEKKAKRYGIKYIVVRSVEELQEKINAAY